MAAISSSSAATRKSKEDLSFCIVWSPLPPITWIIPFIGHTGITNSQGVASDFRGPYYVGDDGRMAFGPPTRALKLDVETLSGGAERWDESIQQANDIYNSRMHNLCFDNCHSHVACALNRMPMVQFGVEKWDMVKIAFLMFFRARFLSWTAVLAQFGPLGVLILVFLLWKKIL